MGRWNGAHGRGAGRKLRDLKRAEAEARQRAERERDDVGAIMVEALAAADYRAGYAVGLWRGTPPAGASASWLNGYRRAQQVMP